MPTFSVIIPTFNRVALLKRMLESVWAQRFTDFEVIVVDDGSTDGTAEFVRGLGGRVQLVTQTNLGPGAGRNNGARHARGEYLAFLDSDDLWFPWTLECFAKLIKQHSNPAVVGARLVEFSGEEELAAVREAGAKADAFEDYFASHASGYYVGAGMLVVRREEFIRVGAFTERRINCEDHDLMMRLGASRGYAQVVEPVTLGWRRHPGSVTFDVKRSLEGVRFMVAQERGGIYPGGHARQKERRRILTSHLRPVTLDCLRQGFGADAWALYRASFGWHVALGRWKYLAGFPVKALFS
jgi:cellulose synthase/poly-beta-1,6-N-acetylglucosamine synthase-like glycosyltransferase